jgi:CheY-like chemotaxis protein
MVPVMNGLEFLKEQSRDPVLLDIPIILTATPPQHPLSERRRFCRNHPVRVFGRGYRSILARRCVAFTR